MSTRANINFLDEDDNFYTIPISSDGYPSGVGPDLVEALKKTDCRSIRKNKEFLKFADSFVIAEPYTDYEYQVDVSGKEFKIEVHYGTRKKVEFKGTLDEFAAWMKEE